MSRDFSTHLKEQDQREFLSFAEWIEKEIKKEEDMFKGTRTHNEKSYSAISPAHYNTGDIETIDYIVDKLSEEAFKGFCLGNVLKYVSRAEHKNGIEDLKKAQVYLDWAINGRN